jgi:hypothetical protein
MKRGKSTITRATLLLLLLNTTRTRSGPPSTRATITMDGGVADTARANTNNSCEHKPLVEPCCCCSTQRAHSPDFEPCLSRGNECNARGNLKKGTFNCFTSRARSAFIRYGSPHSFQCAQCDADFPRVLEITQTHIHIHTNTACVKVNATHATTGATARVALRSQDVLCWAQSS